MIAFAKPRPYLKVGRFQVGQYEDDWLRQALIDASHSAHLEISPILDDLLCAIVHYLDHHCSLQVMKVESLQLRVQHMLQQIGFEKLAKHLPPAAPPVTIHLPDLVADPGFELAFFNSLRSDLKTLKSCGVTQVNLSGITEAARHLAGHKKWTQKCREIASEIEAQLAFFSECLSTRSAA